MTSNFMQPRSSTSSLQHHVVLHSNINDSSSPAGNRFELNLLLDKEDRTSSRRQTNSLMTVHEQDLNNDLITDDAWHIRSPTSTSDVTHPQTKDDKPSVGHRALRSLSPDFFVFLDMITNDDFVHDLVLLFSLFLSLLSSYASRISNASWFYALLVTSLATPSVFVCVYIQKAMESLLCLSLSL